MSETNHTEWIPNIILGQDYDRRYLDAPIHYDVLENLAAFYGRDMPVHRHAQCAAQNCVVCCRSGRA